MFYEVFVDKLTLETLWEFIFATTRRSANFFPQIWSELATINFPKHKVPSKVCHGVKCLI